MFQPNEKEFVGKDIDSISKGEVWKLIDSHIKTSSPIWPTDLEDIKKKILFNAEKKRMKGQ